ncbi:MAG: undecaprenyl-diphosphatase UppP [Chloroflexi bacterium]|nr:undecaprenyl-diphosphatase UppP [Chloroflexota bacterium]
MDIFQAIILGIVQGLTEFAPVSSSAHLVLTPYFLGWQKPGLAFDTTLHLGTLAAVVIYFWRDVIALARAFSASLIERRIAGDSMRALAWLVILGTLPAVIAGLLLESFFESLFQQPGWVGFFLLITGTLLFATERVPRSARALETITWRDALAIGIAQAIAILPGISRSGSTIAMGMTRGLERAASARFSFLLSMPIILGAGVLQLLKLRATTLNDLALPLVVGFIAAGISGYLVIRFLMRYLKNRTLDAFAIYCWILGALTLIVFFAGWR